MVHQSGRRTERGVGSVGKTDQGGHAEEESTLHRRDVIFYLMEFLTLKLTIGTQSRGVDSDSN